MGFYNLQTTGNPVSILDEGLTLTPSVGSIDFRGAGVAGSAVGNLVTETIPGGGGGSWQSGAFTPDGYKVVFVLPTPATSFSSVFLELNNATLTDKNINSSNFDYILGVDLQTITMASAPLSTDIFIYKYQ